MTDAAKQSAGADWFREGLTDIMSAYVRARTQDRMDSTHVLWGRAKRLKVDLESNAIIRSRTHLRVQWSFGQGAWARIPWIALLDDRMARATSAGIYVIYLFREDMSGVYLTLNQGITKEKGRLGADAGRHLLRRRSEGLRKVAHDLATAGFELSGEIDLHTSHSLGNDYRHGTVAHRLYSVEAMPSTPQLLEDLQRVLVVYERIRTGSQIES